MMKNWFLHDFVEGLAPALRRNYVLPPGLQKDDLIKQSFHLELSLPDELLRVYGITYAPRLAEYQFLTLDEISEKIESSKVVYGELWKDSFIPVALLLGVGDLIVVNLEKKSEEGCQILDGFHESPPDEWRDICFGLENWLKLMTQNQFKPFWY